MKLRPYQADLVARCAAAFRTKGRTGVMQLGTGGGKTATASEIARRAVARGSRVVFAAPLDTLVSDTHARITAAGIEAGYVQAGRPTSPNAPVQVASLQTLHARGERPEADVLIIDECHRAASPTIRAIIESYPTAWILGLTATPQRGDGQPLDMFEWMECGPSVRELTRQGHLVPCDVLAPAAPVEALVSEPVEAYLRHVPSQRALFFCASIDHAEWVAHGLASRHVPAAVITGETGRAEREDARARFGAGDLKALCSVNVFIEGWDCPETEAIVLAREFGVVGSFLQAIGRGLRPAPGKRRCTVLDLRGSVNMHGLPDEDRVWSLDGKPRRVEKLAALTRCVHCAAIFRPASVCPRCGEAVERGAAETRLPRVLTRDEKLERLSHLTQEQRDERYFHSLVNVARVRMRKPEGAARAWARVQFEKRFGREYREAS